MNIFIPIRKARMNEFLNDIHKCLIVLLKYFIIVINTSENKKNNHLIISMDFEGAFFNTQDYELTEKKLGKGSFGTVYLSKNIKDNQLYATKFINSDRLAQFTGQQQMLFMRESLILHKLHHPAIVKFFGINFQAFDNPEIFQPTIITEYLSHGSLREILNLEMMSCSKNGWNATKRYISLLGIASAMRYMHKHGIIHRDLKPENILVDENLYPRICDFGLSRAIPEEGDLSMTKGVGTPLYTAPEIIECKYGPAVDVFAFSFIAYEIVTGKELFSESEKKNGFKLILKIHDGYRPNIGEFANDKMKELLTRCWSQDPEERPSFDEIFNLLSSDFSYFDEYVDADEIKEYLETISEKLNEDNKEIANLIQNKHKKTVFDKEARQKVQDKERKCYKDMIENLAKNVTNLNEIKIKGIFLIVF